MSKEVDEFVKAKVRPEHQDIVAALRALMRETAPDALETISYGIPAWRGNRILAVMNPSKSGITFSFSRGAGIIDKYGLLEGVGKVSKHVKMKSMKDVDEAALKDYIWQALALDATG
ncbi:MAG: hypothetical protein A4E28_02743 [Methanocella sp. PtaU1.Bin125]|nr:MAG: hypothetical protein A4E28_02743 [Methanocella sp. PtaU1.Bin125]